MEFSPKSMIEARVVDVNPEPVGDKGAVKLYMTLVVINEQGQEEQIKASIAPWLSYLNDSVMQMKETPDQVYGGFHLLTKHSVSKRDGSELAFVNLLGLHGISAPADWQDQLEAMGLARQYVKGNKKAALPPPGSATGDLGGPRPEDETQLPPMDEEC